MSGFDDAASGAAIISQISAKPPFVPTDIPQWSPAVLELHTFLQKISPDDGLPSRRDVDPTDVPNLLPHLMIIELGTGIEQHRYRLAGSNVAASAGLDYTGKRLIDVHPTLVERPESHAFIEEIRESRLPHWYNGPPRADHRNKVVRIQNLIAPMSENGKSIDSLLGVSIIQLAEDKDFDFASPKRRPYLTPSS